MEERSPRQSILVRAVVIRFARSSKPLAVSPDAISRSTRQAGVLEIQQNSSPPWIGRSRYWDGARKRATWKTSSAPRGTGCVGVEFKSTPATELDSFDWIVAQSERPSKRQSQKP